MTEQISFNQGSDGKWKIRLVNALLLTGAVLGIAWGAVTYLHLNDDLYTNDAQVEEYINPVNTRISGYIKKVYFQEHQHVRKGDTLVTIDEREYRIQLESAQAAYLSALASRTVSMSTVRTVHNTIGISDANIRASEAKLLNVKKNLARYANLLKEGAATQQQFDQVQSDYDAAAAQTRALEEQKTSAALSTNEASGRTMVSEAEVKRAHAALDMAALNLSYTVIQAPYDGTTGRRTVQEGQLLQAGQTLLSFVRNENKWVIANYTEEQVARLHVGQVVKLAIDGLEDAEFPGKVAAISEATGSRYSAIPLDNSTGNFVKVRQRVPVRIEFVNSGKFEAVRSQLKAGMNVIVRL
jgi:membrane fusion protein (multidrug efflux system)